MTKINLFLQNIVPDAIISFYMLQVLTVGILYGIIML